MAFRIAIVAALVPIILGVTAFPYWAPDSRTQDGTIEEQIAALKSGLDLRMDALQRTLIATYLRSLDGRACVYALGFRHPLPGDAQFAGNGIFPNSSSYGTLFDLVALVSVMKEENLFPDRIIIVVDGNRLVLRETVTNKDGSGFYNGDPMAANVHDLPTPTVSRLDAASSASASPEPHDLPASAQPAVMRSAAASDQGAERRQPDISDRYRCVDPAKADQTALTWGAKREVLGDARLRRRASGLSHGDIANLDRLGETLRAHGTDMSLAFPRLPR